ncbi:MAG: tetratricopeptide repeat protein [Oscillatoria princeps RMCB-10]|jgi:tetratricopeptide (TPR) repeat protein|nr:tetratricopeptide repeat protein [Oscillatoria princeps RMCB-10]
MSVTSIAVPTVTPPKVTDSNRQIYERLKLALSLDLRRQIFVAVCDDLPLRNRLAADLEAELACAPPAPAASAASCPQLVTLQLNFRHPNPIAQIAEWLAERSKPRNGAHPPTGFQILGVEHLTRQRSALQWSFLSYLRDIDRSLSALESNLLLWVPRPWLQTIQQSAAEFWSRRTGVFEFEGEPKPAPCAPAAPRTAGQNSAGAAPLPAAANGCSPLQSEITAPQEVVWDILARDRTEAARHSAQLGPTGKQKALPPAPVRQSSVCQPVAAPDVVDIAAGIEHITDLTSRGAAVLRSASRAVENISIPDRNSEKRTGHNGDTAAHSQTQIVFHPKPNDSNTSDLTSALSPTVRAVPSRGGASGVPRTPFPLLKQQSGAVAELVDLVIASAEREVGWGAELNNSHSLQTLENIEGVYRQQALPGLLAGAYQTLAELYRTRIELGDASPENLTIAIRAYQQVLEFLDAASGRVPDILNDLGNLYWMLSRRLGEPQQKQEQLELAIHAYHAALMNVSPQRQPLSYATVQNNLGAVCGELARYRQPAENWQQSVLAYQEALRYRGWELEHSLSEPVQYAATLNNLGTAYWNLAQHCQPVPHLRQAISAYNEAIRYCNFTAPLDCGMLQNNLGTAYWNLAQYEQPEDNLLLAISAYEIALTYRTKAAAPAACAATQNNLGTAYWHLAAQCKAKPDQRLQFLQQCARAYEAALNAAEPVLKDSQSRKPLSFDIFATHNNLGLAHYHMATEALLPVEKACRFTHLETALHHHLLACKGWQQQPDSYQNALNFVAQTIRAFYTHFNIQGQNSALSKVPGNLLADILRLV